MKLQIFFFFFLSLFGQTAPFCMCQVITSLKLCRFGAYLAKKTQQQDEITFNSNEIVPFWGLFGKKNTLARSHGS